MKPLLSFFLLISIACKIYAQSNGEPHLKQVGLVATDVLALTIHTGSRDPENITGKRNYQGHHPGKATKIN